ncbi:MAG: hypothetical protein WC782_03630 [Methylococcaceae bacterium]|jgi:hypothetical protein
MNFVISVIHYVEDPAAAADYLCNALGFQKKVKLSPRVVENGAISIRLELVPSLAAYKNELNLAMQTQNLAQAVTELATFFKAELSSPACAVSIDRKEAQLICPHHIRLTLVEELNEDQIGILPDLPTSLIWDTRAEACIKETLRQVPVSFRELARQRVTERAEMLAAEQALLTVNLEFAVQALADVTPNFQHAQLVAALLGQGVEPGGYFHTVDA